MALLHQKSPECTLAELDLANDAAVGLINYPLNTIFSQCDVILGDRLISQSSATHPYRAMIETLLNYSEDTLKSQFSAGLFYKDTAGAVNSIVTNNGPNRGLNSRAAFSANSREVDLFGPLHGDVFFCERLLLNSVDMRIKLTRASDAFCLMGARDSAFRLRILGASLFVKKVTVSPAIRLGHAAALQRGNALYPLSRVNVKTYSIPANSRICNQENLFLGAMPKYVVLGMVHHEAFTGRRDLSPFNFIHNSVEYMALCKDGRQVPAKAFQPQFNQGSSVREFYNMFIATGRHLKDLPLSISRDEFNHGYSLFVFNLNPTDDSDALSPVSNGNLRLEMRFRVALPHTTTLIVYACYDSILEINSKRQLPLLTRSFDTPVYFIVNTHPADQPGDWGLIAQTGKALQPSPSLQSLIIRGKRIDHMGQVDSKAELIIHVVYYVQMTLLMRNISQSSVFSILRFTPPLGSCTT
ncbi:hypothetical protein D9C73_027927 [Collichthys lucidus]|uniref:Uncharacterized protein n=1 Tax=Collichthys lucidus TaxID=240159 RepID=A0A4U5TZJ8_COLLU|nr:hypothetical protein D9C73_027927 [Collichthys lucidus]